MSQRNTAPPPGRPEDLQRYLVRADVGRFARSVDNQYVDVCDVPSFAMLFADYDAATRLADRLRRRGYPQSCVCDLRGDPLTFAGLKQQQAAEEERQRRFWAKHEQQ